MLYSPIFSIRLSRKSACGGDAQKLNSACRIIAGAVNGNFRAVFEKISKLHAKNSFSLAIILGDFFADPTAASPQDEENVKALLKGEIGIPLATYFTLGKHPLPAEISEKIKESDDDVCPNLYFLDKCCTTRTSEGIKVVNLAGTLDKAAVTTCRSSGERFLPSHTQNDARALLGSNSADILITSHWPLSIRSGSKVPIPEPYPAEPLAEQNVADLCKALKPRYHFSTSDQFFYEREPFSHPLDERSEHSDKNNITRFISLAAFNNAAGAKWLYAFNLDPTAPPPPNLPPGTTLSPLSKYRKRSLGSQSESYSRFSSSHHPHQHHNHHHSKRPRGPPTPAACFFCLSNPNLATHLIASIATESYLTTAKGPLSTASTFPGLGCPAHILIIPLEHSPTLGLIPDPESRQRTETEMHRYRRALQQYVSSSSSSSSSSSAVAAVAAAAKISPHTQLLDDDAGSSGNNQEKRTKEEEENKKNENPHPYLGAVTWELSRTAGVHIHWQFLPIPISLIKSGALHSTIKSAAVAANPNLPPFTSSSSSSYSNNHFRIWIFNPSSSSSSSSSSEKKATGEERREEGEEEVLTLPLPQEGISLDAQFGRRVMAKLLGLEGRANWKDVVDLVPPEENIKEEERDANVFKEGFKRWDFSVEVD